MFNLSPLQVSRMTQTPGTPAFMPPEVMAADPTYGRSVDVFSYGILVIHVFSGRWPEPQIGPNRTEAGMLTPVSEAERREVFLQIVGNDHPLMDLINGCICNDPQRRIKASKIVDRMSELTLQLETMFANRLEMLKRMEVQEEEKRTLKEEMEGNIKRNENVMLFMTEEMKQKEDEICRLRFIFDSDLKQLQRQVKDLKSENQFLKESIEAKAAELVTLHQEGEKREREHTAEREQVDNQLVEVSNKVKVVSAENIELQSELLKSNEILDSLQREKITLKRVIADRDREISRKDCTTKSKSLDLGKRVRELQAKDATIAEMHEEITKAKEFVLNKQQVSSEPMISLDLFPITPMAQDTIMRFPAIFLDIQ